MKHNFELTTAEQVVITQQVMALLAVLSQQVDQ